MHETKRRGAYRRKDTRTIKDAGERERRHVDGNTRPDVNVNGVGEVVDRWFGERGMKPSISEHLQTNGVTIGVKRWVSRKGRA